MSEPWFEAEDIGCSCTENGIKSEWEWHEEKDYYICADCNETQ